jgi:CheY-like chemotaxis protein
VVTADANPATRARFLVEGTFRFLTKPFQVEELLDTIDSAVHLHGSVQG